LHEPAAQNIQLFTSKTIAVNLSVQGKSETLWEGSASRSPAEGGGHESQQPNKFPADGDVSAPLVEFFILKMQSSEG
jgi:hypothetical protein